jgi:hypothetical protein
VVAEVVAYELLMLVAVVTAMGSAAVPPMKPFSDDTGPEKVVKPIDFLRVVALVRTVSTKSAGPVGTNNIPSNADIAYIKKKGRDFSPPFPPFP